MESSSTYEPWSEANVKEVVALWQLNDQDEQRLRDFQRRIQDLQDHSWNDPHQLVRFMLGPQGHTCVDDCEAHFRRVIQWRRDNQVDDMLDNFTPDPFLLQYASPMAILKDYDRDGDPIYVERGGAIDGAGLLKRYSHSTLMRHAIWLREVQNSGHWVEDYELRQNRAVKEVTVVYDLQGLCRSHYNPQVLAWFQECTEITDEYFPSPMKRIIVIRAPAMLKVLWSVVKHFLPKSSRDKLLFASHHNYLKVLDQYMDIAILPPCINPQSGQGETAMGMPKSLVAGKIPDHIGTEGEGYISCPEKYGIQPTPPTTPLPFGKHNSNSSHTEETTNCEDLSLEDDNSDHHHQDKHDRYACWDHQHYDHQVSTNDDHCHYSDKEHWEEVVFSESYHQTTQVHVLWQEMTGVEVSRKEINNNNDGGRNLVFI